MKSCSKFIFRIRNSAITVFVLTSQRLLENISRLEGIIAQEKTARQTLATDDIA